MLVPAISPTAWLVPPINLSANYAVSLSTQQFAAILIIVLLTFINTRSIQVGKLVQNVFTMLIRLSHLAQDAHVAHLLGIWTKCANPISMQQTITT